MKETKKRSGWLRRLFRGGGLGLLVVRAELADEADRARLL